MAHSVLEGLFYIVDNPLLYNMKLLYKTSLPEYMIFVSNTLHCTQLVNKIKKLLSIEYNTFKFNLSHVSAPKHTQKNSQNNFSYPWIT